MASPQSGSDHDKRRRSAAVLYLRVHGLELETSSSNRPVVRLCALMLSEALLGTWEEVRVRAPGRDTATIQYGRAGEWLDVMRVPPAIQAPLVNRLKVMANLDVAKRPVQEGPLKVQLRDQVFELEIVVRVAGDAEEASVRLPAPKPVQGAPEAKAAI